MRRLMHFLLFTVSALLSESKVWAHEVRPAYLGLTEVAQGEFDVIWKVPSLGGEPIAGEELPHEQPPLTPGDPNSPRTMPCGCPAPTAAQLSRGVLPIHPSMPKGAEIKRRRIRTGPQGLENWELTVHGLSATMVDVLVRIAHSDRRVVSRMLRPDAPSFTFRAETAGPAASGSFVASEIVHGQRGRTGLTERAPWIVAFTFGLLHGLGFAGALIEVGLPQNDVPMALLLFNLGVEAGQLAFVAMVLAVTAALRRFPLPLPPWTRLVSPYAIGGVAMFWGIQRIFLL